MAENKSASLTGLTDDEAKEFHGIFTSSMGAYLRRRRRCPHPGLGLASLAVEPGVELNPFQFLEIKHA